MAKKITKISPEAQTQPLAWWRAILPSDKANFKTLLQIIAGVAVFIALSLYAYDWINTSEQSSTSKLEVHTSERDATVVDDDNASSYQDLTNQSVVVSDDFPAEVPIIEGRYTDESRSEVAGRKAWTLTVASSSKLSRAVTDIKKQFADRGWSTDSELVDDRGVTYASSRDALSVVVYITSKSNYTEIQYTISERNSSNFR